MRRDDVSGLRITFFFYSPMIAYDRRELRADSEPSQTMRVLRTELLKPPPMQLGLIGFTTWPEIGRK